MRIATPVCGLVRNDVIIEAGACRLARPFRVRNYSSVSSISRSYLLAGVTPG